MKTLLPIFAFLNSQGWRLLEANKKYQSSTSNTHSILEDDSQRANFRKRCTIFEEAAMTKSQPFFKIFWTELAHCSVQHHDILVRYGSLDTWINLFRLYPPRFYQPRYNLGRFYLRRYYPSWFYPGSLSQKRILVITSILFWVSEPG